jgi:hypothetical protein
VGSPDASALVVAAEPPDDAASEAAVSLAAPHALSARVSATAVAAVRIDLE